MPVYSIQKGFLAVSHHAWPQSFGPEESLPRASPPHTALAWQSLTQCFTPLPPIPHHHGSWPHALLTFLSPPPQSPSLLYSCYDLQVLVKYKCPWVTFSKQFNLSGPPFSHLYKGNSDHIYLLGLSRELDELFYRTGCFLVFCGTLAACPADGALWRPPWSVSLHSGQSLGRAETQTCSSTSSPVWDPPCPEHTRGAEGRRSTLGRCLQRNRVFHRIGKVLGRCSPEQEELHD